MKRLIALTLILLILLTALLVLNRMKGNAPLETEDISGASFSAPLPGNPVILSSQDACFSIAAAMASGTDIQVERAMDEAVKMADQSRWFKENDRAFASVAKEAAGVISLKSVWDNDPLYAYTRRHNLYAVNTDAAEPVDPQFAGVGTLKVPEDSFPSEQDARRGSEEQTSPYVWLSLSNGAKMAELIARDFKRINPDNQDIIDGNLRQFKKELMSLKSEYEMALVEADAWSVIALTPEFVYLTDDFNIDVVDYLLKDAYFWSDEDLAYLKQSIEDMDTRVLISSRRISSKLGPALEEAKSVGVVLETMDAMNSGLAPEELYLATMRENLRRIAEAFDSLP
jgi:ABC-type Zn uptake system ZnuABC Zn-binding protein ZnuA